MKNVTLIQGDQGSGKSFLMDSIVEKLTKKKVHHIEEFDEIIAEDIPKIVHAIEQAQDKSDIIIAVQYKSLYYQIIRAINKIPNTKLYTIELFA